MEDYKPNSHSYKDQQKNVPAEKKVEKVVSTPVKVKKKNGVNKLADVFISEDAANVKSYVFMDVLVPAIKKALSDIVKDGIDMILYGGTGGSRGRSGNSNSSYVSYRSYSDRDRDRRDDRRYDSNYRSASRFDFGDIIFANYGEADRALEQMKDIIDQYDQVSVGDLYDMVELSKPYTANDYGWTNLRNAEVIRVRDGYMLKLPSPKPLR